jgi:hypothetical protein
MAHAKNGHSVLSHVWCRANCTFRARAVAAASTTPVVVPGSAAPAVPQNSPLPLGVEDISQEVWAGVVQGYWMWRDHRIRYQRSASTGVAAEPSSRSELTSIGGESTSLRANQPVTPNSAAPAKVLLVHGFGGNADHWRKNTGPIAAASRAAGSGKAIDAWAIDLLGYGFSDKPDPLAVPPNSIYCFSNWGSQLVDFIEQVRVFDRL